MNRQQKITFLIAFDSVIIISSSLLAYLFLLPFVTLPPRNFWAAVGLSIVIYIGIALTLKLFLKINRYTSIRETLIHMAGVTAAYVLATIIAVPFVQTISFRFMVLSYLSAVTLIPGARIFWRIYHEHHQKLQREDSTDLKGEPLRTLIVGAGDGGSLFVRSIQRYNYGLNIIGFVDDDITKQQVSLYGIPVLGQTESIPQLVKQYAIEQITIAIPTLSKEELNHIVEICSETPVKINQMPSVEEVVQGQLEVSRFREIEITDLLGREEVNLDMQQISQQLTGKTILVSGAGGSIGSEICRQISRFSPKRIILLGHGENSIYLINKELNRIKDSKTELVPIIADIQDRERIFKVMEQYKPDRVYHAAAHKHVPLMEYNPTEAVKNNVYGTKNMAEAAKTAGVGSFVMVSTDKAVNPPNVMGATKRIAEMIVTGLNEEGCTNFVAVRFGNVLGSRGSVIPLFKEQIQNGGPITVTDYRMTRYFMTIPEASRLVLQAGTLARGGEIFVLDMGEPVKILDLARTMIQLSGYAEEEIGIVEAGIRPGEKLYEELLAGGEHTDKQVFEKIFVGKVNNQSLKEVMQFVQHLDYLTDAELKIELVEFANQHKKEKKQKEIAITEAKPVHT
ncbi:polysaccharide biosynthesis protein [Lacticigenium naphthae]|uniref:polysaccharide biosynthesis protein n=1 Tax=Lacticigenium naphthae TaxID=515351 RepID=UPI00041BCA71|nr:nucleoside-diphosphate sugar epimerase/dehydratase [Lacticigenium naphthae]